MGPDPPIDSTGDIASDITGIAITLPPSIVMKGGPSGQFEIDREYLPAEIWLIVMVNEILTGAARPASPGADQSQEKRPGVAAGPFRVRAARDGGRRVRLN